MRPVRVLRAGFGRLRLWVAGLEGSTLLAGSGTLLLLLSSLTAWVAFPLSGRRSGFTLALFGECPPEAVLSGAITPLSFGAAAALLGLLTALSLRHRPRPRQLFLLGSAAVLLSSYFFLDLVFRQPGLIRVAVAERRERASISRFSNEFLDGNARALQRRPSPRPGVTEVGSDLTSVSSGGLGWRMALLAGLLIQLGSLTGRGRRPRPRDGLAFGAALTAVALLTGVRAAAGEWLMFRADQWRARGFLEPAVSLYERAAQRDPSLRDRLGYQRALGEVLYQIDRMDRPETHLFLAGNSSGRERWSLALDHCRTAARLAGEPGVAADMLVDLLSTMGENALRKGNISTAIDRWEEAWRADPGRLDVPFFLAHAYFLSDHHDQGRAITLNQMLLGRIGDKLVRSDVYNNLGYCYYRQGDVVAGRRMFRRSLESFHLLKRVMNFNALEALQGL
jgi:tetratricopeptide (TPR) repeat protein